MTNENTGALPPPARNPGPPTAALPTSAAPMWWDGGDRAITAREKATIEEHGPSCYTVPLVPAQAVDPTDPWRGLYLPARRPAPSEYGDLTHPDTPLWPDDREDALDKLVHAQGFDFHIVAGDFTEEAMEDGGELYWQELRAWNPEAPEGEWHLAWKGDTEDGPYAWFVRPMALRPEPVALAATGKQQVGEVQWSALASLPLYRLADDANGNRGLHRDDTGSWVKLQDVERALAARQPGAQVPVGQVRTRVDGGFIAELFSGAADRVSNMAPLYVAPPAQGIDLAKARDEGHDGAIRYVLGYLNGVGDWGSTQYVEILNACGRERIIQSAVQDDELDFTGLGRWVAERGTDEDRALLDAKRDAAPGMGNG